VLASVGLPPPTEKSALLQGTEDLSRQVAAIRAEQVRLRANYRDPYRTIPDRYPVRHIHDYSHQLFGSSIFSKIHLVRAYNQIPVHSHDIQKMAIATPFGHFEFPFMSFGLRNAAQTFHRFMDDVLRGLDFCFAYLDHILIFSRSPEEHEQHLRTLFDRFQKCGILINPVKSVFRVPEITFLGYKMSAEGSQPLEERVTHLQNY
jgi:cytoskeleton-associated protein 5